MDGVRRKRCETCVYHVSGPTPCTGICRNLVWQPQSDAIRFVRDRELACYCGWGIDYWSPKPDSFPTNGSGGSTPGAGGGPGGGGSHPAIYGTRADAPAGSGSAYIRLIPIELLAVYDADLGFDPDPRDGFAAN